MEHIDHILVVDDDRDIRELIVDYLVKSGYRASGAANGKEMRVVLDKQLSSCGAGCHDARR